MEHWWNVRYLMFMVVDTSAWAVVWKYHDTYTKLFYNLPPVWTQIWNIQNGKCGHPRVVSSCSNLISARRGEGAGPYNEDCIALLCRKSFPHVRGHGPFSCTRPGGRTGRGRLYAHPPGGHCGKQAPHQVPIVQECRRQQPWQWKTFCGPLGDW